MSFLFTEFVFAITFFILIIANVPYWINIKEKYRQLILNIFLNIKKSDIIFECNMLVSQSQAALSSFDRLDR